MVKKLISRKSASFASDLGLSADRMAAIGGSTALQQMRVSSIALCGSNGRY
jgi:hypothetical protein